METDRLGLNGVVVFLSDESSYFQREVKYGKNGNIFNLWIHTVFFVDDCALSLFPHLKTVAIR